MHTLGTRAARHARRSLAAVSATVIATGIVACGSSSPPGGAGPAGGPLLEYAQCMRAHGVPSFPDPSAHGGLAIPDDIDPRSPAFESAEHVCGTPGPGSRGQAGSSQSRKLELVALAKCMRAHGVPSFSDPTSSPPPPSDGNALGGNGWWLALGTPQERRSPAYTRAAAACGGTP
jgi:hypothetical protein